MCKYKQDFFFHQIAFKFIHHCPWHPPYDILQFKPRFRHEYRRVLRLDLHLQRIIAISAVWADYFAIGISFPLTVDHPKSQGSISSTPIHVRIWKKALKLWCAAVSAVRGKVCIWISFLQVRTLFANFSSPRTSI